MQPYCTINKDQFELAFRRAMDDEGSSYDEWDIAVNWREYQKTPEEYSWLDKFKPEGI